jgi:hypothetical protein
VNILAGHVVISMHIYHFSMKANLAKIAEKLAKIHVVIVVIYMDKKRYMRMNEDPELNRALNLCQRFPYLTNYQDTIIILAKYKEWGNDLAWLWYGVYKELGELSIAYEKKQVKKYGSEFAGIMHYLLQLMKKIDPEMDLDRALIKEILRNLHHKKKTYIKGRIVKR